MQKLHVITGAAATASRTAMLLAEDGERVRLVSRKGAGPDHPLIEKVAADATDTAELTRLLDGADTLINCAAPAYHLWPSHFPALAGSLLEAVKRTGVSYVMLGNLYGYGLVDGPITPDLPLLAKGPKGRVRAAMWEEAVSSGARVTEVRAAQFYGRGVMSEFGLLVQPQVLSGALALVPSELDVPHSFAAIGDVARTLVAATRDERVWGRAWHVPVATLSVRALATRLADVADAPAPRLEPMTERELALLAFTDPFWAELREVLHTPGLPYVVDYSETEEVLGIKPSPVDEVLAEAVQAA
ncbi:Rossmann-fold NAD(P)-binding domain-containing protein [Nonomuraea recticatena]|uniref:NAD-dependent epimerase/dehydratase family protein n=1 Tax=Nonomuraea recticatena TaxID=46178 RepID=A0ABN3R231_9ACTN